MVSARKSFTFGCVVCCLLTIWYILHDVDETSNPHSIPRTDIRYKQFLYYVMVRSCLPTHLMDVGVFGNETECRCCVLVLFYKSECALAHPKHIRYIDGRNTTWAAGRNMLYREAKKIFEDYAFYTYHTFLDGDIKFIWTPRKFFSSTLNITATSPLRAYEEFLLRIKPAVGAPDYFTGSVQFEGCSQQRLRAGCFPGKYPEYALMFLADASLNSFHKNALDNLFPMNEHFEKTSWWTSQQALFVRMNAVYPLQNVRYHAVAIVNQAHSPYPGGLLSYPLVADDEREMAPSHLRNASFWKQIGQLLPKYDCFKISHQQVKRTSNLKMMPYKILPTYNESMFGKSLCR